MRGTAPTCPSRCCSEVPLPRSPARCPSLPAFPATRSPPTPGRGTWLKGTLRTGLARAIHLRTCWARPGEFWCCCRTRPRSCWSPSCQTSGSGRPTVPRPRRRSTWLHSRAWSGQSSSRRGAPTRSCPPRFLRGSPTCSALCAVRPRCCGPGSGWPSRTWRMGCRPGCPPRCCRSAAMRGRPRRTPAAGPGPQPRRRPPSAPRRRGPCSTAPAHGWRPSSSGTRNTEPASTAAAPSSSRPPCSPSPPPWPGGLSCS
mmetsp:Transcript_12814/g.39597  ORF Transcript_12814/g.39597 Transcript_12814/m.39597 type:complete len:256 (+) Transcript_12814:351-1118(+)